MSAEGLGLSVGQEVPPFELEDLHGKRWTNADWNGQVVLLFFLRGTW